jgi:GntR family transcriptional regulator
MSRFLKIDTESARPIFQQVVDAIERKILSGEFAEGSFLPSVRDLALDLGINPNTVARAFLQLQRDGIVESVRGLGLRVKELRDRERDARREKILVEKCVEFVETTESLHVAWGEALDQLNRVRKGRAKWKPQAL